MTPRIEQELSMVRNLFEDLEVVGDEPWFRILTYPVPTGLGWNRDVLQVAAVAPPGYPTKAPYGIYVPEGLRINGNTPSNYKEPAPQEPPFAGRWGVFSWSPEKWQPTADPRLGPNLLNFIWSFRARLLEGN